MKHLSAMKKFLGCACTAAMLLGMMPGTALAATSDEYTYQVTVYAGTLGDDAVYSVSCNSGDDCNVSGFVSGIVPNDDRYQVRGVAVAGSEDLTAQDFAVTSDVDLVVVYYVPGEPVEYTVNYVDEDGNAIADPDTYTGNNEEKPVIAFKLIDGWIPVNARNLTGTITTDGDNNFTFIYRRGETVTETIVIPADNTENTENGTAAAEGGTAAGTTAAGTTAAGTTAAGTAAGTAAAGTTAGTTAGEGTAAGVAAEEVEDVPELVDLDDEAVPQANIELDESEETETEAPETEAASEQSTGFPVATAAGAVIVIAGVVIFVLSRKRK